MLKGKKGSCINFIDKILPEQPGGLLFYDMKMLIGMSVFLLKTARSGLLNKEKTVKITLQKGSVECCPEYRKSEEKGIDFVDI